MQEPPSAHGTHLEQALLAFILAQAHMQRAEADFKSAVAAARADVGRLDAEITKTLSAYNALVANTERGGPPAGVSASLWNRVRGYGWYLDPVRGAGLGGVAAGWAWDVVCSGRRKVVGVLGRVFGVCVRYIGRDSYG